MSQPGKLFAHRLALEFGEVNVETMLAKITPDQLIDWETYHYIEPFGRETELLAMLASMFQNVNRASGSIGITPDDLIGAKYDPRRDPMNDYARMKAHFAGRIVTAKQP